MQKFLKNSDHSKVFQQLQNLTPEDRLLLGLYIYEGLSTEEVNDILNSHASPKVKTKKDKNSTQRNQPRAR